MQILFYEIIWNLIIKYNKWKSLTCLCVTNKHAFIRFPWGEVRADIMMCLRLESTVVYFKQIYTKPFGRKCLIAHLLRMLDQKLKKNYIDNEWGTLEICLKLYHNRAVFPPFEGKGQPIIFSMHKSNLFRGSTHFERYHFQR